MKKTLFALTALALMGGQAWADEVYTHLEGAWYSEKTHNAYGKRSSEESVSGGNVAVTKGTAVDPDDVLYLYGGYSEYSFGSANNNSVEIQGGKVQYDLYGGYSEYRTANNNSVKMQGGAVKNLIGGQGSGGAKDNTVAVTGGTVSDFVYGGRTTSGAASGNTVIISGGFVGNEVCGGKGEDATNNAVHLVGAGATATINGETYTGQEGGITIGRLVSGGHAVGGKSENNSVNLYGNSITADAIRYYDHLNFFLTNSEDTVLTLNDTRSYHFYLDNVELGFTILDETFAVESIVLAEVQLGDISLSAEQLAKTWNVTNAEGEVAYQGKLSLNEAHTALTMNFTAVPEPATATLSLLALAALAARRKRK